MFIAISKLTSIGQSRTIMVQWRLSLNFEPSTYEPQAKGGKDVLPKQSKSV
jgi:hypothetical protein